MQIFIYALKNVEKEHFYVGKTNDVKRRMREHRRRFNNFTHEILEVCAENWLSVELGWIERLRKSGATLLNKIEADALGAQTHDAETRRILSEKGRGKKRSAEWRAKVSAARKGKSQNWSPEGRARVASTQFKEGHSNGYLTAEQRSKMLRGIWNRPGKQISAELRRTWSNRTLEQREAIAAKKRAHWEALTPEQRARRLAGISGRVGTEAARAKALAQKS